LQLRLRLPSRRVLHLPGSFVRPSARERRRKGERSDRSSRESRLLFVQTHYHRTFSRDMLAGKPGWAVQFVGTSNRSALEPFFWRAQNEAQLSTIHVLRNRSPVFVPPQDGMVGARLGLPGRSCAAQPRNIARKAKCWRPFNIPGIGIGIVSEFVWNAPPLKCQPNLDPAWTRLACGHGVQLKAARPPQRFTAES
jgi:hypothetical protein